ncbi:DUF3592 domain-containing protein [Marinobacter sp.]|uniref:DUF3592 domain-containing protein n=1 Tax=Marinobacter sp. TaxID=50741 RepID=UPI002B274D59|nr:hypothetical protein [Marinobacter sp.]
MIEYVKDMWLLASEGNKQGVLFFIVVYVFVMCLYSFFRQFLISQWPMTKGILKSASVDKWGVTELVLSDQDYKVSSLYKYKVADDIYHGHRVSPWIIIASHNSRFLLKNQLKNIRKDKDGTVNVFYNPKKPEKSYLIKPGVLGMAVTLDLAVLPFIFYLNAYS